jgi:hypothetical protein
MNKKKLLTIQVKGTVGQVLLVAAVALALLSAGCGGGKGGKNGGNGSGDESQASGILSANMALLEGGDQVPDYKLNTNDSLLRFETPLIDLGRMKIGQTKNVTFDFTNASATPVVITRVVTTCGCTSADYEKTPLMPGKASKIKVGFEAEEQGVFFKKIFVYCAGESAPLEIAIKGEVR